ncbi:MAG TPA: MFS transporter [Terracidiphilus sp.]|nr:MFS transporter [Terracidiphilus sp.]
MDANEKSEHRPETLAAVEASARGFNPEVSSRVPQAVRALRNPNFRLFWSGNFLSNIGSWMENVARGWLILLLTNSPLWLGVVGFAGSIPFLLFTLFGGVIADRADKRRLLMVTQTVMMLFAFLLAALAFFKGADGKPLITVWEVTVIAFLNGIALAMNAPSYQAMVPKLVQREDLTNAIALNSAQFNMSRIVGPTLGGYAMAIFGVAGNFFLNGLSFLAVLWALVRLRFPEEKPVKHESMWRSLRAGFAYLRRERQMLVVVMMTSAFAFLGFPFLNFIPYFAKMQLGLDESGLGWLMACSGFGAVLGAMTVAVLGVIRHRGVVATIFGITFFAAIIGFSLSRNFWLSAALALIEGYSGITMVSCFNVSMQHLSSDEMRGRVLSIYTTAFLGLPPLGSLMAGWLSQYFDAGHVLAAMASTAALIYAAFYAFSPALRSLD